MNSLEDVITKNWSEAQKLLGDKAARMLVYAQSFDVPVVKDGAVSINEESKHKGGAFVIALSSGERLKWANSFFCGFSPRQLDIGRQSFEENILKNVEQRVIGAPGKPAIELQRDSNVAVLRNRYQINNFPEDNDFTEFNFRPLMGLRYNEGGYEDPGVVAMALHFMDKIIENPVIVRSRDGEPAELYTQWRQEAADFGGKVLELIEAGAK